MAEQIRERGSIVLVNPHPQVTDNQGPIVDAPKAPILLRRLKGARTIVPKDESASSDWTIAQNAASLIRSIRGMKPSLVNRALSGNINHHPTEEFEIIQGAVEGQQEVVSDIIEASDGSLLSLEKIDEQDNLLPGPVESGSGLIPLTNLENQNPQTVKTYDVGIVSARKLPQIPSTELKKAD